MTDQEKEKDYNFWNELQYLLDELAFEDVILDTDVGELIEMLDFDISPCNEASNVDNFISKL